MLSNTGICKKPVVESVFAMLVNTHLFGAPDKYVEIKAKFSPKTTGDPSALILTDMIKLHGFSIQQIRGFVPSYLDLVLGELMSTVPLRTLACVALAPTATAPPPAVVPFPQTLMVPSGAHMVSPDASNNVHVQLHSPVKPLAPGSPILVPLSSENTQQHDSVTLAMLPSLPSSPENLEAFLAFSSSDTDEWNMMQL